MQTRPQKALSHAPQQQQHALSPTRQTNLQSPTALQPHLPLQTLEYSTQQPLEYSAQQALEYKPPQQPLEYKPQQQHLVLHQPLQQYLALQNQQHLALQNQQPHLALQQPPIAQENMQIEPYKSQSAEIENIIQT